MLDRRFFGSAFMQDSGLIIGEGMDAAWKEGNGLEKLYSVRDKADSGGFECQDCRSQ